MKRKTFSLRLDPDLVTKAKDAGLDISQLIENQLKKTLKVHRCPTCGSEIKKPAEKHS